MCQNKVKKVFIMKYSLDKYKFYQYKNENGGITLAAASTYGGKTVKGYAKCDPRDEFDFEKGKDLAAARCNAKIAEKRVARASRKYLEAKAALVEAQDFFNRMYSYYVDAVDAADEANAAIVELEDKY